MARELEQYDAECLLTVHLLHIERIRAPAADIFPSGPRRQEGEPLDAICRCGNWLVGTTVIREVHSERHTSEFLSEQIQFVHREDLG